MGAGGGERWWTTHAAGVMGAVGGGGLTKDAEALGDPRLWVRVGVTKLGGGEGRGGTAGSLDSDRTECTSWHLV